MTKKIINTGLQANDRKGDPLRIAFGKINDNFTELYDINSASDLTLIDTSIISATDVKISSANNVWDFQADGKLSLAKSTPFSSDILGAVNTYPLLIAYGENHGGPEFDWMNTANLDMANESTVTRHAMYFNGSGLYVGINENQVAGDFHGNWQFATDGSMYYPDNTIQLTAYPGGEDNNIWALDQTTGSELNNPPIVSLSTTSVVHDWEGNIIATIINNDNIKDSTSIVKYSPEGILLWQKTFSQIYNIDGWSVAVDSFQYVYVVGVSSVNSFIAKLSLIDGNVIWQKFFTGINTTSGSIVSVDTNDNPIVSGWTTIPDNDGGNQDQFIIKFNRVNGDIIWQRTIGNTIYDDQAWGMAIDKSNSSFLIGFDSGSGGVVELTAVPTIIDPNPYLNITGPFVFNNVGPQFGNRDISLSIVFDSGTPIITVLNGGKFHNTSETFTILGTDFGLLSPEDDLVINVSRIRLDTMLISKYNSDGVVQWSKSISQDINYDSDGVDAITDFDGNLYVLGQYKVNFGNNIALTLIKMDSTGGIIWSKTLRGTCDTIASSITIDDRNTIFITGTATNNILLEFNQFVASYDTDGSLLWNKKFARNDKLNVASNLFFGGNLGTGSAISAYKNYVVICGSVINILNQQNNNSIFNSYIAQLPKNGNKTSLGPFIFGDSNLVDSTVVLNIEDAIVTDAEGNITTSDGLIAIDSAIFVQSRLYDHSSSTTGDVTFDGVSIVGAGSASGDGNGYGTLELVPDKNRYNGNDQYLIIDPTSPNHIHVRAGGRQDNSNAILILGAENNNVQVSDATSNVKIVSGSTNVWEFDQTGSIVFPSLTTGRAGTGETLKFGNPTVQSIITGPDTTQSYPTSQRIVIQGTTGFTGTTGEGGDIYLWAGNGGDAGGTGGDIKVDGGQGVGTGEGGTIKIRGGYSPDGTGGFVEIRSGDSNTGIGGPIDIWAGAGNGGTGVITFHINNMISGYETVTIGSGGNLVSTASISDKIGNVRIIPQNLQTNVADYTVQLLDSGKHIYRNVADTNNILIPSDAMLNFEIGTEIIIVNGDGITNILPSDNMATQIWGNGFNLSAISWTITPNSMATILKIDADKWILSGPTVAAS